MGNRGRYLGDKYIKKYIGNNTEQITQKMVEEGKERQLEEKENEGHLGNPALLNFLGPVATK